MSAHAPDHQVTAPPTFDAEALREQCIAAMAPWAHRNKLLVLNAGSSSLKFKLFELAGGGRFLPLSAGLCERIGEEGSRMRASADGDAWRDGTTVNQDMPDHRSALRLMSDYLSDNFGSAVGEEGLHSVGHRVVHGGPRLTAPGLITPDVRAAIKEAFPLAPLHNPANLHGIDAAIAEYPAAPHVAVFDTAFHAVSMPREAYTYALPYDLCQELSIRRFGFHGISCQYLLSAAARVLNRSPSSLNLILCHLGAGCSVTAVRNGQSVDTSMGFTPLEGLMMGSRCGDIDPAILPFLMSHGYSLEEVNKLLNFQSGFQGLAGSIDVRKVEEGAEAGNERCQLALDVFVHRVRKYLGAYMLHLGGQVDAIVFSAGVGENGSELRERICQDMKWAGVEVDEALNAATIKGKEGDVSTADSRVKVLVLPTDEQLEIAEQTLAVVASAVASQRSPRLTVAMHKMTEGSSALG